MAIYEPWSLLQQLHKELESKSTHPDTSTTAEWVPLVDIKEEAHRYVVWADLPGVSPDAIDITMENGILTLNGEREIIEKTREQGYKRVERTYGSFSRRFSLPDTADAGGITARSQHGVLEISITKKIVEQPKKIRVFQEAA